MKPKIADGLASLSRQLPEAFDHLGCLRGRYRMPLVHQQQHLWRGRDLGCQWLQGVRCQRYPLINIQKLWNITIFNGKNHYKWPFSIAMLNYQRDISKGFFLGYFWGYLWSLWVGIWLLFDELQAWKNDFELIVWHKKPLAKTSNLSLHLVLETPELEFRSPSDF